MCPCSPESFLGVFTQKMPYAFRPYPIASYQYFSSAETIFSIPPIEYRKWLCHNRVQGCLTMPLGILRINHGNAQFLAGTRGKLPIAFRITAKHMDLYRAGV